MFICPFYKVDDAFADNGISYSELKKFSECCQDNCCTKVGKIKRDIRGIVYKFQEEKEKEDANKENKPFWCFKLIQGMTRWCQEPKQSQFNKNDLKIYH